MILGFGDFDKTEEYKNPMRKMKSDNSVEVIHNHAQKLLPLDDKISMCCAGPEAPINNIRLEVVNKLGLLDPTVQNAAEAVSFIVDRDQWIQSQFIVGGWQNSPIPQLYGIQHKKIDECFAVSL